MSKNIWGSDVPISKPGPVRDDRPVMVSMGGFAFTTGGMVHDITSEDIAEIFFPVFAPEWFSG